MDHDFKMLVAVHTSTGEVNAVRPQHKGPSDHAIGTEANADEPIRSNPGFRFQGFWVCVCGSWSGYSTFCTACRRGIPGGGGGSFANGKRNRFTGSPVRPGASASCKTRSGPPSV